MLDHPVRSGASTMPSSVAARLACRNGETTGHTAGHAPGYVQGNLCILPKAYAIMGSRSVKGKLVLVN